MRLAWSGLFGDIEEATWAIYMFQLRLEYHDQERGVNSI